MNNRSIFSRLTEILTLQQLAPLWRYGCFVLLGIAIALFLLVARLSHATSYLSDAPETCVNCYVMNDAFLSYRHGSHPRVASCNDCHVPHSNLVAKYAFKARDGVRHASVFTLRGEPQVLNLSAGAVGVVQANSVRCHQRQVEMIRLAASSERVCWDCQQSSTALAQQSDSVSFSRRRRRATKSSRSRSSRKMGRRSMPRTVTYCSRPGWSMRAWRGMESGWRQM